MSVLNCTVKAIKDGVMKNGNPYQRLCVVDGAGGEQWMPCFNGKMLSVGDKIMAEIKEGQYSEKYGQSYIIEDYVLQGDQASQQATKSQPESTSQGNNDNPDVWRIKDINIAAQAAFKAICSTGGGLLGSDEKVCKEAAKVAMDISIYWDKRARACVNGADINELKRNLADDIQDKVAEADNTASSGSTDMGHAADPEDPGFDDDIPF